MIDILHERSSDSPLVESVSSGRTLSAGSTIRPAETNWHMVVVSHSGRTRMLLVGPMAASGLAAWGAGGEILWIKFKLGVFMPQWPVRSLLDAETALPDAPFRSFRLNGSAWELPTLENADTFVDRLTRQELLVRDPLIDDVLRGHAPDLSPRTLRHRFLRATGLSHGHIVQFNRARAAERLLLQGVPILDTVFEAGYFDQPHLTRSLKQFIGRTPGQIIESSP